MQRTGERLTPERLAAVTCPVLVALGDKDFAGPADPLVEALPDARLVDAEGRRPLRHAGVVRLHRRRTGVPGRRAVTPAAGGTPDIDEAVERLRAGGLVAFPTETVYGLGADASQRRPPSSGSSP